nr:hypothetical protein [Lysinibacillus timonensis]
MFKLLQNERGSIFPIAIVLFFVTTTSIIYYIISFESKINIYNSLEFVNVRATINLLDEINNN